MAWELDGRRSDFADIDDRYPYRPRTKTTTNSLYPPRVADAVAVEVASIRELMDDPKKCLKLNEIDRKMILSEEDKLGQELEEIRDMNGSSTFQIYLDYFTTPAGHDLIRELMPSLVMLELPKDIEGVKRFFYQAAAFIAASPKADQERLSGESLKYADEKLSDAIQVSSDYTLDTSSAVVPEQLTILFSAKKKLAKLNKLKEFKKKLQTLVLETARMPMPEGTLDFVQARLEIFNMYLARVNELITEQYPAGYMVARKASFLGEAALNEEEKELLAQTPGSKNVNVSLSRLDRFVYGAESSVKGHDIQGNRPQISQTLQARGQVLRTLAAISERSEKEIVAERNLDIKKLRENTITFEQRRAWAEEVLAAYGLKLGHSSDSEKKSSSNEWKYIAETGRRSMMVRSNVRTIADGKAARDVIYALSVTLAHEIEGHVLQALNREQAPLRLFKTIKGDRSMAFSEAGAVANEAFFMKQVFGLSRGQSYAYGAAMEKRLQGGNYLDCIKAYYDERLISLKAKYNNNLTSEAAQKELESLKMLAIDRAKRLFRDADMSPHDQSPYLRNSKDSVYVEQEMLIEELSKRGLEKLAYIGGMNLRNVKTLVKLGLLDLSKIQEPKFAAMKIWDRIKENYTLPKPFVDHGKDI